MHALAAAFSKRDVVLCSKFMYSAQWHQIWIILTSTSGSRFEGVGHDRFRYAFLFYSWLTYSLLQQSPRRGPPEEGEALVRTGMSYRRLRPVACAGVAAAVPAVPTSVKLRASRRLYLLLVTL